MGKSKVRGGAKAHRKRVKARNERLKGIAKKQQKMFQDAFMEQIEKMRTDMSGDTNTSQTVNLNTDGFVQSAEII